MRIPTRLSLGMPAVVAAAVVGVTLVADAGATDDPATDRQTSELPTYRLVAGESIAREPWVLPVRGYRLTGRFGDVSGYLSSGSHTGLDFATDAGSPVRSVASGAVVATAYDGAYGNKTVVRLQDGTEVWYCHQDTVAVAPGQQVRRGEVIGAVGSTGNVTGPHLHLEIRPPGGGPVDPEAALRGHRVEP
jgi:murein DD-endopeptidase MepM/ murein hydrolase activator NlpD